MSALLIKTNDPISTITYKDVKEITFYPDKRMVMIEFNKTKEIQNNFWSPYLILSDKFFNLPKEIKIIVEG